MCNKTFKLKAIVVGFMLMCKIQLVLGPIFLKIVANQIVSMNMNLQGRQVRESNMFNDFLLLYDVVILNMFLKICYVPLGAHTPVLLLSPGKGGNESKTHRPEFLSSQVGNPDVNPHVLRSF
jgi:hypothetical protein